MNETLMNDLMNIIKTNKGHYEESNIEELLLEFIKNIIFNILEQISKFIGFTNHYDNTDNFLENIHAFIKKQAIQNIELEDYKEEISTSHSELKQMNHIVNENEILKQSNHNFKNKIDKLQNIEKEYQDALSDLLETKNQNEELQSQLEVLIRKLLNEQQQNKNSIKEIENLKKNSEKQNEELQSQLEISKNEIKKLKKELEVTNEEKQEQIRILESQLEISKNEVANLQPKILEINEELENTNEEKQEQIRILESQLEISKNEIKKLKKELEDTNDEKQEQIRILESQLEVSKNEVANLQPKILEIKKTVTFLPKKVDNFFIKIFKKIINILTFGSCFKEAFNKKNLKTVDSSYVCETNDEKKEQIRILESQLEVSKNEVANLQPKILEINEELEVTNEEKSCSNGLSPKNARTWSNTL